MNMAILIQLFTAIPQLVKAVEAIVASPEAQTIEDAIKVLINHNTPGQPNSAVLSAAPSA